MNLNSDLYREDKLMVRSFVTTGCQQSLRGACEVVLFIRSKSDGGGIVDSDLLQSSFYLLRLVNNEPEML